MSEQKLSRAAVARIILGFSGLGGLVFGTILLLISTLCMIPAYEQGHTGMFGAGFGIALRAALLLPAGFLIGVALGLVVAGIWWMARGRLMPHSSGVGDASTGYPVPPM